MTFLKAWSNLVIIADCAHARPRCQVNVYRTIGPLVYFYSYQIEIRDL